VRPNVLSVGFDHLSRDGSGIRHRKHVQEAQVRPVQPDAQRVTVDRFQAGDRCVVVELSGLDCLGAQLVGADDLALDQPQPRTFHRWVEQAPDRIGVVAGREFARLALECRIRREEDSGLNLELAAAAGLSASDTVWHGRVSRR